MMKAFFLSNVTLGYGNPDYLNFGRMLIDSGIVSEVKYVEPIDYERDFVDVGHPNFRRYIGFLNLKKFILPLGGFFKKVQIKLLNVTLYNLITIWNLLRCDADIVVLSRYNCFVGWFVPKNKLVVFYCSEIFEMEGKHFSRRFVESCNFVAIPQIDRLRMSEKILFRSEHFLIQNCPLAGTVSESRASGCKRILYQGRVGIKSNARKMIDLARLLPSDIEFIVSGPIDDDVKDYFFEAVDLGLIKYVGYLDSKDLNDLRARCSIGLVTWGDFDNNTKFCAPNKLYEYISSGMLVVSFENYSIGNMNAEYGFGIVSDDLDFIADYVVGLSFDDLNVWKVKNISLHKRFLNYEFQSKQLLRSIKDASSFLRR